jgi:dimethylamine/trimethylamine dehydrogenase
VMAELLVSRGCRVEFVTPAVKVAEWAENTLEQAIIMRRLLELGVQVHVSKAVDAVGARSVTLSCAWTGAQSEMAVDAVVMVTSRVPHDALYHDLRRVSDRWTDVGVQSVKLIGDAAAPGPIAWATYAGRRFAEEIDEPDTRGDSPSFRREVAGLEPGPSRLPI